MKPFHASLMRASYTRLWSLTARLYLRPSITQEIEPSAITLDSMHRFRNPASRTRFPTIASNVHMVEYSKPGDNGHLKLVKVFPCDLSSFCIYCLVKNTHDLVNSKDRLVFSDWLSEVLNQSLNTKRSMTVAICVSGALVVGRYPHCLKRQ